MKTVANGCRIVLISCVLVAASGCAGVTPHENFKEGLRLMVGYNIDTFRSRTRKTLLSESALANGNVEYRFLYRQDCTEIYEVDPKTRLIVRADFEGSERSCTIVP